MMLKKTFLLVALPLILNACQSVIMVRKKIKSFMQGQLTAGLAAYTLNYSKDDKYQFCDGDFIDYGCYTGHYSLSGDTITLLKLRKHDGIPTNRFLIRRYKDMDSTYWQWKYSDHKTEWHNGRHSDLLNSATGDIFPLDHKGKMVLSKNNYFLIRMDSLEQHR